MWLLPSLFCVCCVLTPSASPVSQSAVSHLSSLLSGFFTGLQANPQLPSSCVSAFTSLSPSWTEVTDAYDYAVTTGQLANMFVILSEFNNFVGLTTNVLERCSMSEFAMKLSDLATVDGVFKAMYQVGINIEDMAVRCI